jgi:enoyl-CoA hydratase
MIAREDRGSIAVLRIEHGKANTMDLELLGDVSRELAKLKDEPVKALVVTGSGRVFSAGVDLYRLLEGGAEYVRAFVPRLNSSLLELYRFSKPVIAALNGHAIAGGFILACCCDRRVMAKDGGKVGLTELPVGVPFPSVPLEVVRSVVPSRILRDLVYGGRLFLADEALQAGLIDEIVDAEGLLDSAIELAEELAHIPGVAFGLTKQWIQEPVLQRLERSATAHDAEVLRAWSDPETHAAIRRYVEATLKAK